MEDKREDRFSHILKYTGLFGGVQGLIILIGLVRNKAMALLLGAGGIGLASLLTSAQNFASQCTNLGISFGAVPKLSELYEQNQASQLRYYVQVIRLWSLVAAVFGLVFCVVVSPLLNDFSFSWGNHTLHYSLLAFAVAMGGISGGELAILKATRRLSSLARIQVCSAVLSVVVSVPLYYYFHHTGVLPAIVLIAFVNMLTVIAYSYRFYPLRWTFSRSMISHGIGMIKLGVSFVGAAAIGSGADMLIRAFLNVEGGLDDVGLYNVAYMITITYAGMVFTAMETDYFPRLSAVRKDIVATNDTVNRQMEVSLLLLAPMLVFLLMMLPVLVPLLFSADFMPVVGMAQVAVLAMYFKVLTLPVAYITLARSRSLSYLFLETSYYVFFVLAVVVCFRSWGVWGTGLAVFLAHVFDYVLINGYAYWHYGYRFSSAVLGLAAVQLFIGFLSYAVSCLFEGWLYWTTEAALAIASTACSLYVLRKKTRLWQSLKRRVGF